MKTKSTHRAFAAIALGLCAAMPVSADPFGPPAATLVSKATRSFSALRVHEAQPDHREIASVASPTGALGAAPGEKLSGERSARGWVADNALALALFAAVFVGAIAFQRRSADV